MATSRVTSLTARVTASPSPKARVTFSAWMAGTELGGMAMTFPQLLGAGRRARFEPAQNMTSEGRNALDGVRVQVLQVPGLNRPRYGLDQDVGAHGF